MTMDLQALTRPRQDGRRPGRRFGPLIVTSGMNASGAPWRDLAITTDAEGNRYRSWSFAPVRPGRRTTRPRLCLVVGWRWKAR